ncbi:cobyrinic acid a,c-diamide synthase [Clostridium acetobutylicum]|uniref:Cobyrinate a,c-diamide synthase n=1 Tax=Clostridium acetobutylicum (strain ATCC 824 / DSM 792 / JCM 1419 / IAM 19013 / LMG 5710 / NBRC 13948 / NRRL B-527 / VKM B-1787 / 2291 / W) TaxID=272562 RepID=CBIA_CLOAB|nr:MULTISPECIES: cobyrinate a,c-diamide synthase [Clostridium]Q97JB1.1 RecName: Full=Cobyrinate a,c-diamide synthase; AltName: Full=Cobyrinic acid a,c-diamide synthetase [Clostridium acetobutylicum ATCC 824]AAK79343.1 Cobyrinic acid a,c-diamide synthase CobB [Clostridium acetobutylicum ATCC 824]ADZ20426.1 Cobyrinic acid a,c-diamide synthase CobB [Clostridium acetobutylicum EA 2018]AEI34606.1 cobyrinic acid a,c-diamide synthase [Clostridium acetobutylicum DSM 1731]AWV81408.1 cobyrinate a,c-diam
MRSIIIASNSSGGGKTTVTLGLMKALVSRGLEVQGFKVGPDYIDTAFHESVTGKLSRNLDLFLMGEDGVKASFARGNGDYGIIEGVMGLYDGRGVTSEYSTAHLSKILKLPIVLVLTPKAQSLTLCAEIEGIVNFDSDINIVGVILNNISEGYYNLLRIAIEEHFKGKIKVFGYLPKNEALSLKSRHLGLVQSVEINTLNEKLEKCSELLENHVKVDELLKYFSKTSDFKDDYHLKNKNLKIAVAKDEAFNFYYKENLELLHELGEVTYFSPLKDKKLPENIDFLYIGGGYPEIFKDALSENKDMLLEIKNKLEDGTRCYAECGGLMYLMEAIEGSSMVGFFKGSSYMGKRLQNFGYAEVTVSKENRLLPLNIKINCHEFHKSYVNTEEETIYSVTKYTYLGENKSWRCGYTKKNVLAAYAHVHFFGNLDFLKHLVR